MTTLIPDTSWTRRTSTFGPILVDYDERVLMPRQWTLAQSEWAAQLSAGLADPTPILELCAGAGHIGLAAAVLTDRDLVQVEADPVAAAFARSNARRADWAHRVDLRVAQLQTALRPGETFDLIIADPPYLTTDAVASWPADPPSAIDGGPDGLTLVRACLDVVAARLTRSGSLLLTDGRAGSG